MKTWWVKFVLLNLSLEAVPVFHTVNEFQLDGEVCPLPTVRKLPCPHLCVRDISTCPRPPTCPTGYQFCVDGTCQKYCSPSKNLCSCGGVTDYVPCDVDLSVTVNFFNASTKAQQVQSACAVTLNLDTGIPSVPGDGIDMYWSTCPAPVLQNFTYREPMWITVFSLIGFEFVLLVLWSVYKCLLEKNVERLPAREFEHGDTKPSPKGPKGPKGDTGFSIRGYRTDYFGCLTGLTVMGFSVGWVVYLGIITGDYYGAVTGTSFGMALENFDASSRLFIGIWVSSVMWFVSLVIFQTRLFNLFRIECSPLQANYIQVEHAQPTMVLLETNPTWLLSKVRYLETLLKRLVGWDVSYTCTPLLVTTDGRAYFSYRCTRYVYDHGRECFQPYQFPLANFCNEFHKLSHGLSTVEAWARLELKGPNFIPVQVANLVRALAMELTGFFYLYQLLILWLFYYFAYYQIGLVDTALVFLSALIRVVVRRKAQIRLKAMAEHKTTIKVIRDGCWQTISSDQIVPGDVLEISRGLVMPCDGILLKGVAVVDESSLTGEPLPVRKTSLVEENESYDGTGSHKSSTIYAGTTVAQASSEDTPSAGLVLAHRTATDSDRGALVRRILYPNPVSFVFDEQLKVVVLLLGIWGIVIFILAIWLMQKGGTAAWFYAMFGFAQVLSPLLPAALVVGQTVAAAELQKKGIHCVDLPRIMMAGKVKLFCFDKTGTLTKEGLEFIGCRSLNLDATDLSPVQQVSELDGVFSLGIASCHGVAVLDGALIGNPVDVEMFAASHWKLKSSDSLESPLGQTAIVVQRFEFVHARASMSVAIQDKATGHIHVFLKGAFEKVASVCPTSVPPTYFKAAEEMARQGCYVLAMAHKDLGPVDVGWVQSLPRDELEAGLTLLGLVSFQNQLKPDTKLALRQLREGATRSVMITGDNPLTGIYIARASQMATIHSFLLGELNNGHVTWHDPDVQDMVYDTDGVLNTLANNPVELAMTGQAFNHLNATGQLGPLLLHTRVFARMAPRDKVTCVELLMAHGITAMCGDGGNDCGALRAAHVGLALSEAEASIVSPFSSSDRSISSCVELLRQGRAALAGSFASYKFLIMYGQTMAWLKLPSFYLSISLSQNIWILVDAFVAVGLSYAITQSRARDTLAATRPTAQLLGPETLASTLGLLVIHLVYGIGAFVLLYNQSFFRCNEFDGNTADMSKWWLLGDSYEGEILGIVCLFQFVNAAAVFNFGHWFRRAWYRNYWLVVIWSLFISLILYVTLADPNWVGCLFRINCGDPDVLEELGGYSVSHWLPIPSYNLPQGHNVMPPQFRATLVAYCLSMLAAGILWEWGVVLGPVRHYLRRSPSNSLKL